METIQDFSRPLQPEYPWLKFLVDNPDLDVRLQDVVSVLILDVAISAYNTRQFNNLLQDVATLLDRCLAYRREYQDLAGQALQQAMDYKFFTDQRHVSENLELASWIEDIKQADGKARALAADHFASAADKDPLAAGFSAMARADQAASEKSVAAETARKALVRDRWGVLTKQQDSLKQMHSLDGHPLNFGDRAARISRFLLEDFKEAGLKAMAAQRGIQDMFGYTPDYSWQHDQHPLDQLVILTRGLIRGLDRSSQTQINFIAYCEVPFRGHADYGLGKMTVNRYIQAQLDQKVYGVFRLEGIAARIRCTTLRHGGSSEDIAAYANRQMITSNVCLRQPEGPRITLPHVGVIGPDPQDYYRGSAIEGLNPWYNTVSPPEVLNPAFWFMSVSDFDHPDASISLSDLDQAVKSIVVYFDIAAMSPGFGIN